MKRGSWFTELLNLLVFILETLLSSSKSSRFEGDQYGTSDEDHPEAKGKNEVQAALDFFEIKASNDSAAIHDLVKKKFRKLSLLHHPDRNENSEESVETMQKVNHHYDVLCEELDRREGVVHEEDKEEEKEGESQEEGENQQEGNTTEEEKQHSPKSKKKKRRQRAKKRSRSQRHQQCRRKQQAAREMEEEMQEIQRQKQKVNATKRKMKNKVRKTIQKHHLHTAEGRAEANQEFVEAMNQFAPAHKSTEVTATSNKHERMGESMHDIDDDDISSNTEPPSLNDEPTNTATETKDEKPRNLVMDCCMDDIAVALCMELADVAITMIQRRLADMVVAKLKKKVLENQRMPSDSDIVSATESATLECFQRPLDEDGNSALLRLL